MIKAIVSGFAAALLVVAGTALAQDESGHDYPEARLYDVSDDAMADVDAALARASANGKRVLVAFGGNWCHDSRAFAGWTQDKRIGAFIDERFELVFVNVGIPQEGDGHNGHILERFGMGEQVGTPLVLALTASGEVINAKTAQSWRNTASRSEDDIYNELEKLAK